MTTNTTATEVLEIPVVETQTVPAFDDARDFGDHRDLLTLYQRDVARHRLLDEAEVVELARRVEAGVLARERLDSGPACPDLESLVALGTAAKELLVVSNLRLVMSMAWRYTGNGMALMDLVQAGNLGLVRAVEKFDWRLGNRFSTYATWWVRQAVTRSLADDARTVRVPVHMVEQVRRAQRARDRLLDEHDRLPTTAEVAAALGDDERAVAEVLAHGRPLLSLEEALEVLDDLDATLADPFACDPVDVACEAALVTCVRDVLSALPARDALVLRLRHGLDGGAPQTLEEIGRELGLTRERIRQIESKALERLRAPARIAVLEAFVGGVAPAEGPRRALRSAA